MKQTANTGHEAALTRGFLILLAVASGVCVANLYYNQPLLAQMQATFGVTSQSVGYVSMITQLGYALGLFLFVPLGDMVNRRKLILSLMTAAAMGLVGASLAPSLIWLYAASFLVGLASVIPQVIIPLAAQMAEPERQGKVIGIVVSGLLIGILLARTVSGLIGGWWGWRLMYGVAAVLMLLLFILLRSRLPSFAVQSRSSYAKLLLSMGGLIRKHRTLREATLIGSFNFACFSLFWTIFGFHVNGAPFHYSSQVIGLFGLVGAVGAWFAPISGRLADRMDPKRVVGLMIVLVIISFAIFQWFGNGLIGLIIGIILMDLGIQGAQVQNQSRIYGLDAQARSRLNTVFIVSMFIGGAVGSYVGSLMWSLAGWSGVAWSGIAFSLASLLTWGWHRITPGLERKQSDLTVS
jgi:predicted MFS family arabinose efflux permease